MILLPVIAAAAVTAAEPGISFDAQIRPLLSDRCFKCHGPDHESRKANLRFDQQDSASAMRDEGAAIVPGDPEASLLVSRIFDADADFRMPPVDSGKSLSSEERELLREWIAQGAQWEAHWAFEPPKAIQPPLPGHPVDAFVNTRLSEIDCEIGSEADKATLLRRVTLDLTGLPPTASELDAFLSDASDGAWERVIDRLMDAPGYGEHMARDWLDAARYADTHGLHLDNERVMWKYRDWVVGAFASHMPYDQFIAEQLAGDLLPDATLAQQVASGFNRCHVTTSEGGSILEEVRIRYAMDRTDTVATVFLGLTATCAACHDHKFDPITQRDYYQLLAFFNNTADEPLDGNIKAPPPVIKVPDTQQASLLAELETVIAALEERYEHPPEEVAADAAAAVTDRSTELAAHWQVIEPTASVTESGGTFDVLDDESLLLAGSGPATDVYTFDIDLPDGTQALRLDALRHEQLPAGGPGRATNANFVLTEAALQVLEGGEWMDVPIAVAEASFSQENFPVREVADGDRTNDNGWAHNGPDAPAARTLVLRLAEPMDGGSARLVLEFLSQYSGHSFGRVALFSSSHGAEGVAIADDWESSGYLVAESADAAWEQELPGDVTWTLRPEVVDGAVHAFKEGLGSIFLRRGVLIAEGGLHRIDIGTDDGVRIWIDGDLVHEHRVARTVTRGEDTIDVDLVAGDHEILVQVVNLGGASGIAFDFARTSRGGLSTALSLIAARGEEHRSELASQRLRREVTLKVWPEAKQIVADTEEQKKALAALQAEIPTTLVSVERSMPQETRVLRRGQYDQPTDVIVGREVPTWLPPMPDDAPIDRLGFAQWLTRDDHPLTARVFMNRLWQHHFGVGLVITAEDFGSQGARPSHPDLLDWLAVKFIESGWDIQAMQRLMLTSDAYRQSAVVDPELARLDPENALLGRAPRFRLDAEVIRDQALAVSGLLVPRVGGPPVKPYQPPNLWEPVAYTSSNTRTYVESEGDGLWRRSIYTFWKRTSPPAAMAILDAPTRESCIVRRERTNTPMAALLVMNDDQFVEAARGLAQRALLEGGSDDATRLTWAFRVVTARAPTARELARLRDYLVQQQAHFSDSPEDAAALLSVGASMRDGSLAVADHAAWTMVANLLLNLDEVLNRG